MQPSPIRWVGGKSRLRKKIIDLFPPHTRYCEPFAGGAWVFFGKARVAEEVLGDIDPNLINFYRVVRDRPEEFIHAFEWTLVARAEFERLRDLDPATLDDVERAYRFFYLLMAGWGGELGYPRFQVSMGDVAGGGNRLLGAIKHLRSRILPAHERLQGVTLENIDWREFFDSYDEPGTVIYCDPPYSANSVHYQYNMRELAEHEALAARLARARCRWMLSAYDTPETRALYPDRFIAPVEFTSGMESGKRSGRHLANREVLVTNFWPKNALDGLGQALAAFGKAGSVMDDEAESLATHAEEAHA